MAGILALRAAAYTTGRQRIGVLPDVLSMTLTVPRTDTPTLTLTYPVQSEAVRGLLLDTQIEVAIEYTNDGENWIECPDARFISFESSTNPVGDGTQSRSLQAVHVSNRLNEALVWDAPQEATAADGKRHFLNATPGMILRTVWDAATARGWGKDLTLACTVTDDASGARWATKTTIDYEKSITIGQIVDSLTTLGMIETTWVGRTLYVYNTDTTLARDRTNLVWRLWRDTTGAPERTSWADICTDVLVKGENGRVWHIHNDAAPPDVRRIEKVVEAGGVEKEATAALVAQATLRKGSTPAHSVQREWAADATTLLPWRDYRPGDWITVETASGMEKMRVAAVSVTYDANGVSGHTTFGTLLDDYLTRLARKTKGIAGYATAGGSGVKPAPEQDLRKPRPPVGIVGNATVVPAPGGWHYGIATLTWQAVTTDTKDTAIDVAGYEVRATTLDGAPRGPLTTTASNSVNVTDLDLGATYRFTVRARSRAGVVSDWSPDHVDIEIPTDTTPPPVPTAPVLAQVQGVLQVTWDGHAADGSGMPNDLDHLEAAVTTQGTEPTTPTVRIDPGSRTTVVAGLPVTTHQVRLRAVDRTGNTSSWSAPSTITLEQTVDKDAISKQVDDRIRNSAELDKKVTAETLKTLGGLGTAADGVLTDPYPPDTGTPGSTLWVAPDGRIYRLTKRGA